MRKFCVFVFIFSFFPSIAQERNPLHSIRYVKDIPLPEKYRRVIPEHNSFGSYLQNLTINRARNRVRLYNGKEKPNQHAHYCIIDLDVGNKDLQQCADAIIRLRAEYLYSQNRFTDLHFNFTSGDTAHYLSYRNGFRPKIRNNQVAWHRIAQKDTTYKAFRNYLDLVFTYSGTISLNKELIHINHAENLKIGDIFIETGSPFGHAMIVVDLAVHTENGSKIFLLAQSFMPAQDIHIVTNPTNENLSPWYSINPDSQLVTPEWIFSYSHLKRFK